MKKVQNLLKEYISLSIKDLWNIQIDTKRIMISKTPSPEVGHLACNIAFILAKELKQPPLQIALKLSESLSTKDHIKTTNAINGYINIFFTNTFLINHYKNMVLSADAFLFEATQKKVHLEFISANPTGPLHIGHGRWAILGDVIARLLKRMGYSVFTEFYVNNAGNQIKTLNDSVLAIKNHLPIPEDGYHGEYLHEVAKSDLDPVDFFRKQQEDLIKNIDVTMDNYYPETDSINDKMIDKAIEKLDEQNFIYKEDGAIFFKTTALGDDKDRVLIKSNGDFTYFAPDIGYHYTKVLGGYHWIINILGADHHGYVKRISAAVSALSDHKAQFTVLLGQMVNLLKNGQPIRMSKRAGDIITLQEVVDDIGLDALRIILLSKKFTHPIDFDLGVLSNKNKENPLFYIQYAYVRIFSILEKIPPHYKEDIDNIEIPDHLQIEELNLILHAINYKSSIELAVKELEPYYLYAYIYDLAALFHKFYEKIRIQENLTTILYRVLIIQGVAKIFLDAGELLGISVPEKI